MTVGILIPSLGRAQYVKRVYGNIKANTPEPHRQIWCVGEPDYFEQFEGIDDENFMWLNDTDSEDKRYVTRMNKLVVAAANLGLEYVFFGSDDVIHHPYWLKKALAVFEQEKTAGVVVVNDLRNPNGTQALMRMSYLPYAVFDDRTVAFHPGYRHNFADTEMFETAAMRGAIFRALDSHVEHLHPLHRGASQRPWDETYQNAQKQWNVDAELFQTRMTLMREALGHEDPLPG